ncbi:MAG: molybdate ABC transporter substrate-binding protein [Proteobacteria bacterium]|nr:molybdate ABC transporter substrate-binding protein [Pseudomonadota bacterium]
MSASGRLMIAALLATTVLAAQAAELTVSAAASLTQAFTDIAKGYEAARPGDKVKLNFGASGALLAQMAKGAPVDVLATADEATMNQAEQQDLVARTDRVDFARNTLVLIVPADSRLALTRLADLQGPAIKRLAIGNPASVPAGRYARAALEAAGLWTALTPKTIHTQNVRQALDYVARGEVEAGMVYATDAALMKDKVAVRQTVPLAQPIIYPIASAKASREAEAARRFVAYVRSADGQTVLARHGFSAP